MILLALDPGPKNTALIRWDGEQIIGKWFEPNENILAYLEAWDRNEPVVLVIEKIASYGMPVGEEIFETVFWSGRFAQAFGSLRTERMTRSVVKMHLCHTNRAKDSNIRQALIDRFGPPGTKKAPGRTFGLSGDLWAAFALAVAAWDIWYTKKETAA